MGSTDRHAIRILVADEDRDHGDMVAAHLTESGFLPLRAGSGGEALTVFNQAPCPMVLSELKLPDMEGLQFLDALKSRDPSVTVIFMSRQPSLDVTAAVLQKGAYDFIEKPFGRKDLLVAVRRAALRSSELMRLRVLRKWAVGLIVSLPVWFTLGYLLVKWFRR